MDGEENNDGFLNEDTNDDMDLDDGSMNDGDIDDFDDEDDPGEEGFN